MLQLLPTDLQWLTFTFCGIQTLLSAVQTSKDVQRLIQKHFLLTLQNQYSRIIADPRIAATERAFLKSAIRMGKLVDCSSNQLFKPLLLKTIDLPSYMHHQGALFYNELMRLFISMQFAYNNYNNRNKAICASINARDMPATLSFETKVLFPEISSVERVAFVPSLYFDPSRNCILMHDAKHPICDSLRQPDAAILTPDGRIYPIRPTTEKQMAKRLAACDLLQAIKKRRGIDGTVLCVICCVSEGVVCSCCKRWVKMATAMMELRGVFLEDYY